MIRLARALAFLLVASPAAAQSAELPEWYLDPPRRAGWVHTTAMGQSKIDALAEAVGQIADQIATEVAAQKIREAPSTDTTVQSIYTQAVKSVTIQEVASIRVRTLTERFASTDDSAKAPELKTFRRAIELTSADSASRIRTFIQSVRNGDDEEIQKTVSLDGELRIFLDALSGIGARITTQETATGYFVLIAVPGRALLPRR